MVRDIDRTAKETVISVGIDIGTTTTQLVISRLTIQNTARGTQVPRMEITEKEVLYRSQIHFTPLINHDLIDAVAVSRIVMEEYRRAGITPEEIDTGAVIITGETAKKENAQNILEVMAGLAGDFVVATAGANLESILAGKGSGAAAYSKEHHKVVVNIDVGGGTSNIGVFKEGKTLDTACVNVGGHLVELEKGRDVITYIAQPARAVLRECGLGLSPGDKVDLEDLKTIVRVMAQCVVECLTTKELSGLTRELLMTSPLRLDYPVEKVMISGGVADYVYNSFKPLAVSDVTRYGDIGPALGWALREELQKRGLELVKPLETIRATVIGAGSHSVNISGSTIHVNESTLPLRNVAVVAPFPEGAPTEPEEIGMRIKQALEPFLADDATQELALAVDPASESLDHIQKLAQGIIIGMEDYLKTQKPLIIILEKDCAKVLGQYLQIYLKARAEILCIDQVQVDEGDYIDIGKPLFGGRIVPVVVKTLVFENSKANTE